MADKQDKKQVESLLFCPKSRRIHDMEKAERIPSIEERKKIEETLKEQKEAQADTTAAIEQLTSCANCGEKIGTLEKSYTYESHIVCAKCYEKLKSTP